MSRRPTRTVSPERKSLYALGMALTGIGIVIVLVCFVGFAMSGMSTVQTFGRGDSSGLLDGPMRWWIGFFVGMVVAGAGGFLRHLAARGVAGSGLVLDPDRARTDLEPWARMGGGLVRDAVEETGLAEMLAGRERTGGGDVRDDGKVMVRCRSCRTLNDEDAKFCDNCGAAL
jgi:hypothetical protein